MPQLPTALRAAIGAIATVVEERRTLPDKALELPVLAVSTALQISLRAQQRYAALTAKGDEVLGQLRGVPDEPPAWAVFDDLPKPAETGSATAGPGEATPNMPKAASKRVNGEKKVPAPRNGAPSRFDLAGDADAQTSTEH